MGEVYRPDILLDFELPAIPLEVPRILLEVIYLIFEYFPEVREYFQNKNNTSKIKNNTSKNCWIDEFPHFSTLSWSPGPDPSFEHLIGSNLIFTVVDWLDTTVLNSR